MTPRLMSTIEVANSLHLSIRQLEEMKALGAPCRTIDGEERWLFVELLDWIAEREATMWGGVLG
jgi:hypothetical protein